MLLVVREPSLWPELVGVRTEDRFVAMNHPGMHPDHRTGGDECAGDLDSSVRNDSLERVADARVHSQGLFDHGLPL